MTRRQARAIAEMPSLLAAPASSIEESPERQSRATTSQDGGLFLPQGVRSASDPSASLPVNGLPSSSPAAAQYIQRVDDGAHATAPFKRVASRPRRQRSTTTTQCYQCHKLGHFAHEGFQDGAGGGSRGRDLGPRGVVCGGGGRGGKPPIRKRCYKCNRAGHFSRDCKEAEGRCYSCNGTGNISKDCKHKLDEISCYNCGKRGHIARGCKEQEETCNICHQLGHLTQDCPNSERKNRDCYNCGNLQHIRRDCPEAGGNDPVENVYYRCNKCGHIAQNCLAACARQSPRTLP
ncbi:uncharacterized protein LOC144174130 [Haemaphysalis longicornis]